MDFAVVARFLTVAAPMLWRVDRLRSRDRQGAGTGAWIAAVAALTALPSWAAVSPEPVTFSKHIAPIVFTHCAQCHRPGEAGPFPLLTYNDVRKHATQIVQVTHTRYMPPWMPEPGYGDFAGSLRLSDAQLALIARWVHEGMAEGNPADLPPMPKFSEGWQLGPPDLIVKMAKPYQLPEAKGDVFRNFIMPVNLTETKYVRAYELRPAGNRKVVHHANIIIDRSRMLRRHDGEDGQPGFAGMDVETEVSAEFDPDSHFLFWKPGTQAQQEPPDMAWRLDPGSDLIVNLHLQPSGAPETIEAEVGLYFTKQAPTRHPMLIQLEHDGALDIAPGNRNFTITDHLKLPVAVNVLACYPHAHYIGNQFDAWAELPDGTRRPLIKINRWDINWQSMFTYRDPVHLPAGTTISMKISYDNSDSNTRNPIRPVKRVVGGNRSEDEMGHVWFQVLPDGAGENDPRLILQQAVMRRRIEKYPADFVAHFNLGAALEAAGHPEEALKPLSEAVKIRPTNAMARNNLAVALFSAEKFDAAELQFREALKIDPGYENARYNLARTLAAQGKTADALEELRMHLAANPSDADANNFTGRILASARRFGESLPYFRKAAELEPENGAFLTNLGAALASAGEMAAAAEALEKAVKLDPSNSAARDNLARVRSSLEGKKF
jgi:Flp pilus assembly protein TadD/mono/diheme cytochrome c family protein